MTPKTVILDVDGTLIDTNYLHVEAWAQGLAAVGHTTPRAVIHRHIGKGDDQFLPTFLGHDEPAKQRASTVHAEVYQRTQSLAYPLPGAKELLRVLHERGVQLVIASSAKPEELDRTLALLDAKPRISQIVCKSDVKRSKPAPDVFLRALEKAKASPESAVVVGDTVWDLAAAQAAGVRAVAVLTGGCWSRAELRDAGALAVWEDCRDMLEAGFPDVPALR